jgi:hypothetical protein
VDDDFVFALAERDYGWEEDCDSDGAFALNVSNKGQLAWQEFCASKAAPLNCAGLYLRCIFWQL